MQTQYKKKALLALVMTSLFLGGCDDQKKKEPLIKVPVQSYQQDKTLTGIVTSKESAILEGELKVSDSQGRVVAKTALDSRQHYQVSIPAGTTLPIVLTVSYTGSDETLKAVVISPAVSKYDVSLLTTKIANRAKELGGYTYSNMVMAADSTVGVPDANKTSTGFRGDPTKQYGGWH